MGWIQPGGCQFATSAKIQMDDIYGSLVHQPSYPINRRNELRCGLAYQCFLRKDSPLNYEFHSVTSRARGPVTEPARPACHSLSIPSYLVCAKDGGSPLGSGQRSKPQAMLFQASPQAGPCLILPSPTVSKLHFCPPHQPFCLPRNLLILKLPPFPLQPCQRRCLPPNLPPQQCQCSMWCSGLRGVQHGLVSFVTLYFTTIDSSHVYPPSPRTIHQ